MRHSGDCSNVSLIVSAVVDVLVSEEGLLFCFDSYNWSFSSVVKGFKGMFIIDLGPMLVAMRFNDCGAMKLLLEATRATAVHLTFPD